jgi:hypothetical protein
VNCPGCGLENRPYDASCAHCEQPLQEPDQAAAKRREWDLLTPALRNEQEEHFSKLRERFDEHRRWLKSHRTVHTILGAVVVAVGMNAALFFMALWTFPIDLVLGAGAGLLLNRLGGGAYRGLGLFSLAAVLSLLFVPLFVSGEVFWNGMWIVSAVAILFIAGAGYALGLQIDIDHVEHQVL